MGRKVIEAIQALQDAIAEEKINPEKGLSDELFYFASTVFPIINVDLLVTNNEDKILFSWRQDEHHGVGWHIPGGCIRLKETMIERLQRTAIEELGTTVIVDPLPICIRENIVHEYRPKIQNQLERSHEIAVLFKCKLPEEYEMPDSYGGRKFMWFDSKPNLLIPVHEKIYGKMIEDWFLNKNNR